MATSSSPSNTVLSDNDDLLSMDVAKLYRFIASELISGDFLNNGVLDTVHITNQNPTDFKEVPCPSASSMDPSNKTEGKNSDFSSKSEASSNHNVKINGLYAINSIKNILELYEKHCLTVTDTTNLLHSFISRDMLKVPNGTPTFLIQEKNEKLKEFETYYKAQSDTNNLCVYCKWLGLPQALFVSHILKDHRDVIYCPIYPVSHNTVLKFDNFGKTIVKIIEKMGGIKFCDHCKDAGLPRENFMSHIEKLPTGEIICPELRKQRKSAGCRSSS